MASVKALRIPGVLGKKREALCLEPSEQGVVKELTSLGVPSAICKGFGFHAK